MFSGTVGSVALSPEHRCSYQTTDQPSPAMVGFVVTCSQNLNLTIRYLGVTVQLYKKRDPVPPMQGITARYQVTRII